MISIGYIALMKIKAFPTKNVIAIMHWGDRAIKMLLQEVRD
jgi:hypothetical protein